MKGRDLLIDTITGDLVASLKRDANGLFSEGLAVGDVTSQNKGLIINRNPGETKEYPTVGVGIGKMLKSSETLYFKHRIREQLEGDGFKVSYLEIEQKGDQMQVLTKTSYRE